MTLPFRLSLTLIVIALSWIYGGLAGVVTLGVYVAGVAPGLPIGFALFGRRHAAGWAAGALFGYALIAFAFWIPIAAGRPGPWAFLLAWAVLAAMTTAAGRALRGPLVALPDWTRRDSAALLLVLHLVPIIVGSPFARAGERDETGTRYYRAYFTADFVWHLALTQEVARFEPQLKNPYIASDDLHYYWTYFLPAAVIAARGEAHATDRVEATLKIGATLTALLLTSMVYLVTWAATGRRWAAIAAAGIVVLAPSFEGLYAMRYHLLMRGEPWRVLRELNIDAVSAWPEYPFQGLRVDNLPRAMWWTPQHSMSCALGLIALLAASRWTGVAWRAAIVIGLALGLSVTFNPLLGAMFCGVYGLTVLWDAASRRISLTAAAGATLAAVPVALALWWCVAAGMSAGAEALTFGLHPAARRAPWSSLFISLGGVLIPAAIGLLPSRQVPFRPALPALFALALGLLLMHYVTITESSWIGFRAGNVILVSIGMLVARGLVVAYHRSGRVLAFAFAAVLFLAGVPTSAIDWHNARDLENRGMGPGFLWTIPFSPDQQAGFAWVRSATPPGAVVQFDPIVRARQNWSGIPAFTGRRMAAAIPISLLPEQRHHDLSARVHRIFTELPPEAAHANAAAMGIDYLWIDEEDRAATTSASLDRLERRPDLFPPVFRQGGTLVLAVAR